LAELRQAIDVNPAFLEAHHLLMRLLREQSDWERLDAAAKGALHAFPYDALATRYLREAEAALEPRGSTR